jgi:UDP-N-acetylglucosamine/UDP-N-acetylgalactosamine diphosphorylase
MLFPVPCLTWALGMQVYSVDNALVRVADPVFFGFAQEHDADVGVKVIDKLSADEAVGIVCLERETSDNPSNGKQTSESVDLDNGEIQDAEDTGEGSNSLRYRILEYSEAPSTLLTARNGGQLVYRSAHICVNLFSLAYLKKMADPGIKLDFHAAHKCIPCASTNLEHAIPVLADKPNGIKFEQFIFDTFKFCQSEKVALLEVEREEEFAPIKNSVGADSKETARNMVLALQNRHSSLSQENESGFCDGLSPMSLLKAYAFGGSVE